MKNYSLMALVIAVSMSLASVAEARIYCYETYTGKFLGDPVIVTTLFVPLDGPTAIGSLMVLS